MIIPEPEVIEEIPIEPEITEEEEEIVDEPEKTEEIIDITPADEVQE